MKRRLRKALNLTAEDAQRALHLLVSEGKIAARDVVRAIQRRRKLIGEIRQRLAALGEDGVRLASKLSKEVPKLVAGGKRAARAGRRKTKQAISAATRAKYQAQGRYMAALRPLSKALRVRVKKIREKSGVDAAVAAAKQMARR